MKTIRLDITNIATVKALHIYLAYKLELPAYYGKNLDALHDMLGEVSELLCIELGGEACSDEMQAYLPRLERVFQDCVQENPLLSYRRV